MTGSKFSSCPTGLSLWGSNVSWLHWADQVCSAGLCLFPWPQTVGTSPGCDCWTPGWRQWAVPVPACSFPSHKWGSHSATKSFALQIHSYAVAFDPHWWYPCFWHWVFSLRKLFRNWMMRFFRAGSGAAKRLLGSRCDTLYSCQPRIHWLVNFSHFLSVGSRPCCFTYSSYSYSHFSLKPEAGNQAFRLPRTSTNLKEKKERFFDISWLHHHHHHHHHYHHHHSIIIHFSVLNKKKPMNIIKTVDQLRSVTVITQLRHPSGWNVSTVLDHYWRQDTVIVVWRE